jgi:Fur family ferric uptake transcriptional regulator
MVASHPRQHDDVDEWVDTVLERLRTEGGRVTGGRRAIVRALRAGPDHHVTADAVAALVQTDHPDVHLTTVYRTLDALERVGIVERVDLGLGGATLYHLTDHGHHHLVCRGCGAVIELGDDDLGGLRASLETRHGFTLADHHLSLGGLCRRCR